MYRTTCRLTATLTSSRPTQASSHTWPHRTSSRPPSSEHTLSGSPGCTASRTSKKAFLSPSPLRRPWPSSRFVRNRSSCSMTQGPARDAFSRTHVVELGREGDLWPQAADRTRQPREENSCISSSFFFFFLFALFFFVRPNFFFFSPTWLVMQCI